MGHKQKLKMKAFALLALLPLALAGPTPVHHAVHHAPAYGHPAPAYGHPAPAYGHPAPAYGHAPAYGYEQPKHNCSVVDVVETAEVCTPTLEKTCVPEVLPIKLIISVEQCYTVTRTVCTESIEVIPNEVCVYEYEQGGYGHQYCNEVAQTPQYNVPTVPAVDVDVK